MKQQLNWAVYIPPQCGIVSYAESAPGQAKTACIGALAKASGRRYLACELGRLLPEDLGGIPAPRTIEVEGQQVDCVVRLMDEVFLRAKMEPSIVLLDEINQAGHSMLAASQQWINPPPSNAWVFAAGNPLEQSSNGVEFTPPFVNRLCVVTWERPVDARREGWRNGFKSYPAPSVPIVPADYLDTFGPYWGPLMCSFEDQAPDLFGDSGYPKDPAAASKPWPSDRSWTNVGKLLCAADAVGANASVKHALIAGCVGEPAAVQFEKWLASQDLPDPEEILSQPHTLKLTPRFDISRAVMSGVIARVRADNQPKRWELLIDVVETAYGQQPEVAMSAAGAAWKVKPDGHTPKLRNGAWREMQQNLLATQP